MDQFQGTKKCKKCEVLEKSEMFGLSSLCINFYCKCTFKFIFRKFNCLFCKIDLIIVYEDKNYTQWPRQNQKLYKLFQLNLAIKKF